MDKAKIIIFLFYFLILLLDLIIVSDARKLLLDFLIGQRNRKSAVLFHSGQPFFSKLNMGYILPLLKKYQATFKKYHALYLVILYSLIPQYITVVLFHVYLPHIASYLMGLYLFARVLLSAFYRLELGPQGVSVYAKK